MTERNGTNMGLPNGGVRGALQRLQSLQGLQRAPERRNEIAKA